MADFLTTHLTIDRRGFLAHALHLLLAGSVSVSASRAVAAAMPRSARTDAGLTHTQWNVIAAVQKHLLPSEPGIPGAREIKAADYLRRVMVDPHLDASERAFITGGVVALENVCDGHYAKSFLALDGTEREAALRQFEQSASGHRWLAEILEFLMEALLGDPSHGGNPAGIGWTWLGIQPGFPRPPVD